MQSQTARGYTKASLLSIRFGVFQALALFLLGAVANPTLAQTVKFSFEAVLEKVLPPKGEELTNAPEIGTLADGTVEIAVPTPEVARASASKLMDGKALVWVNIVQKLELTGKFNAKFTGGAIANLRNRVNMGSTPYRGMVTSCWGEDSQCSGSGSEILSRGTTSEVRHLTPKIFAFSHDESLTEMSLAAAVDLLATKASKTKTHMTITLSDFDTASDMQTQPRRHARMLWRILRSTPQQ